MREFKFKAWVKPEQLSSHMNGVIADAKPNFYESDCLIERLDLTGEKNFREIFDFDRIKLMEYTGLNDDNGVEIYEGYKIKNTDGRIYAVTFANGAFGCEESITIDYRTQEKLKQHKPLSYYVWDGCEVVGNIYEDKDLLEEEE